MKTIKLVKPIKRGEEVIDEIELREPTAKDVKNLGLPVDFTTRGVDSKKVFDYVVALAALPPSTVDQMGVKDFMQCTVEIVGFFGGSEA